MGGMILLKLVLLVTGFVFLIKGADVFVGGASAVAGKLKIPKMLIGLTIVAFGTSAPEFAVSIKSMMVGSGDMLLGNVIGSNILNILLILGVSAMVRKLKVKTETVRKELPIMILVTATFVVLVTDKVFNKYSANGLTRQDGVILIFMFGIFLYYLIEMARKEAIERKRKEKEKAKGKIVRKRVAVKAKERPWLMSIAMTVGGILGIVLGSELVVSSASEIAILMGVSQKMVALTVVALGTSLPELATSVMATRKGETDIAVGNVVGSNIFNIALVAGVPIVLFGGIPKVSFSYIDIAVMLTTTLVLYLFTRKDCQIGRKRGMVLIGMFVVYYGYVIAMA